MDLLSEANLFSEILGMVVAIIGVVIVIMIASRGRLEQCISWETSVSEHVKRQETFNEKIEKKFDILPKLQEQIKIFIERLTNVEKSYYKTDSPMRLNEERKSQKK